MMCPDLHCSIKNILMVTYAIWKVFRTHCHQNSHTVADIVARMGERSTFPVSDQSLRGWIDLSWLELYRGAEVSWVNLGEMIWVDLSWLELCRVTWADASRSEPSWGDLRWAGLILVDLSSANFTRVEPNWVKLIWNESSRSEPSWFRLSWIALSWVQLRSTELNWFELSSVESSCVDLRWIDWTWVALILTGDE